MREPAFWWRSVSWQSRLLSPAARLYGAVAARRMTRSGAEAGIPVICIGNYHVGGAGKTPVAIALTQMLRARGEKPFLLTRGYGGRLRGPVVVDSVRHGVTEVGDEALLLARAAPTVVARDRAAGAALARTAGASVIVMDDGFQNPALRKDLSLIVMDARRGIGNGAVFPAGPLRAPLAIQSAHTDALIVVGEGDADLSQALKLGRDDATVFKTRVAADDNAIASLKGKRLLAFAGIGDPARFFSTLRAAGLDVAATQSFPDHHRFKPAEIERLVARAAQQRLTLVTTEKDLVRITTDAGLAAHVSAIAILPIRMVFDDSANLEELVARKLQR